MEISTNFEMFRYEPPRTYVCTFNEASLLMTSAGAPDSLTIVDVTDDDDFDY